MIFCSNEYKKFSFQDKLVLSPNYFFKNQILKFFMQWKLDIMILVT